GPVVEPVVDPDGRPALRLVAGGALEGEATVGRARLFLRGQRARAQEEEGGQREASHPGSFPWQLSHFVSSGRYTGPSAPAAWQARQGAVACAPSSRNAASRSWSNPGAGAKASTVWQASHPPVAGRPANPPSCGSAWQSAQVRFAANVRSPPAWQPVHGVA